MDHRKTTLLFVLCLCPTLAGCGFIAAPIAGTATSAAQLTVKGADQGIHYSKIAARASVALGKDAVGGVATAANSVAEAAANVANATLSGLRPARSDEASQLHEQFRGR